MRVVFRTPPAAQCVGGLDSAILPLRHALEVEGVTVSDEIAADAADTIVHFHGLWQRDHVEVAKICCARRIPYVVSPHGMLEPWAWRHKQWKKWPYFHLVEKRHLARAGALLATAAPEARGMQKLFPAQRIEALPLGLTGEAESDYENARRKLGWKPDECVLLFLSRIHLKKGLDLLLSALAESSWPQGTRLVIVGEGESAYVRSLHRLAARHAAKLPHIEWKGAVWGDTKWPYLQGADLFCLPTHSENFGLAVLEACQVGTPALTTTETPWAAELSGGRGFIAPPTIDGVRQALQEFFRSPHWSTQNRADLSNWAHANYEWSTLAPRYSAFYSEILRAGNAIDSPAGAT